LINNDFSFSHLLSNLLPEHHFQSTYFFSTKMLELLHLYFILFVGKVLTLLVSFSPPRPYGREKPLSTRFFIYFRSVANTFVPRRDVPRLVRTTAFDHVQNLCYVLEQIPADETDVRHLLTKILRLWSPRIVIRTPEEVRAGLVTVRLPW
jgi:hypothetical protein